MAISLEELTANANFTRNVKGKVTLLPDPPRAERRYLMISCDDHIVEPPHAFEGRVPAKFADRAPRVVDRDGVESWLFDGELMPNVGFNAVAGRPIDEYSFDPTRFEHMRRGRGTSSTACATWTSTASTRRCASRRSCPVSRASASIRSPKDTELAIAVTRAWNDWMLEDWCAFKPGRMIPSQLPIWTDPELAAAEVRKNAARGFKAISFSEGPHLLGYPSLHTGYWDPLMAACEETGTVVCLHVGSSGTSPTTAPDAPSDATGALFFAYAMYAAVDWLFSKIPVRFPKLRICMSEGGIGWVAGLARPLRAHEQVQRDVRHVGRHRAVAGRSVQAQLLVLRHRRSVVVLANQCHRRREHHGRVRLPARRLHLAHTQEKLHAQIGKLPKRAIERITWRNASELFDLRVPKDIQKDPNAF